MKIILISDFATVTGGAPKVAIESALALSRCGLDVTFIHGAPGVDETLERSPVRVVDAGLASVWDRPDRVGSAIAGIWNAKGLACVRRELAKADPADTIVHIHQWTKSFSPSIFAATGAFRTFVTLHDYFFVCPTGLLFDFQKGAVCKLKPMSAACLTTHCDSRSALHKAVRIARQVAEGLALRRRGKAQPLSFVHVSDFARNVVYRHLPHGHAHYVLENPVTVAGPGPIDVARNEPFLFLGRLNPEKGVMELAAALRQTGLKGLIHGEGPCERALREAYPELEFVAWGGRDGVYDSLSRSRCIVLPTRWNEVQGLAVFEAASVGVPSIVSRNSGAADFVLKSDGGIVIDPHDPHALPKALLDMASDGQAVRRMGEAARAAFRRTEGNYGSRLIDVYQHDAATLEDSRSPERA